MSRSLARRPLSRRRLLVLAAASAGGAALARVRPGSAQIGDAVRTVLANGLVLLVEERPTSGGVAFQIVARAGARDDAALPGLTSMLGRMMFQGTRGRPSQSDLVRAATAVGGRLSANVGSEMATVSASLPATDADLGFDLLADIAANPLLDADVLVRQQAVVLQQLQQRLTNPEALIGDLFRETLFAGHPLGLPSLGTAESVRAITREALVAHHTEVFGASNLVLIAVGRIRPAEAAAAAERAFGALPAGARLTRPVATPPRISAPIDLRIAAGRAQTQFQLGFVAPPTRDPDRYPLQLLATMLNGELFEQVRNARGLAYSAGAGYQRYSDSGMLFATAGVDPENLDETLGITRELLTFFRSEQVSEEELRRRVSYLAGSIVIGTEENSDRVSVYAGREVLGTPTTDEIVARLRAVTPDDVLRAARQYLNPEQAVLTVAGPDAV